MKNSCKVIARCLVSMLLFCTWNVKAQEQADPLAEGCNPVGKIIGEISHVTYKPEAKTTVEINCIPTDVEKFKLLQQQIGKEPQGAVVLTLVAMEMYRQFGAEIGTECLNLCNTPTNARAIISRIKELFGNDKFYARPYQVASFMEGAYPENGYNPTKPYRIHLTVDKNVPYSYSEIYEGTMIFLRAKTNGDSSGSHRVYVLCPDGDDEYCLVTNCPGFYFQTKKIRKGQEFKGL